MNLDLETMKLILEQNEPSEVEINFSEDGYDENRGFYYVFNYTFGEGSWHQQSTVVYKTQDPTDARGLLRFMASNNLIGGEDE